MIAQGNVTHLIVGKDITPSTGLRSALSTGQMGVYKNGSQTAANDALTAGDVFTISFKDADGQVINTPHIKYDNIVRKSASTYAAATQKLTYVGYNGTTGSLAVSNSDVYIMRVILKDPTRTLQEHPLYEYAEFTSDASATQVEIADGIIASAIKNFTSAKPKKVTVVQPGRICNAAVTTANDFTGATTVVQGSNVITITEASGANDAGVYGAGNVDLAVGDYVRIGGVGAGTALTSQVYKVTALGGSKTTSILATLDRPVLEASGTYAAATHDAEVIPAAAAASANWGISLLGVALPFSPGLYKYGILDFEVLLNEAFDTTLVTDSVAPYKGVGTYSEVAELESFLKYNRGETYRVASYPVNRTLNATSGKTYNYIVVDYKMNDTQALDRKVESYATLMIATEVDSSGTPHASIKTVLGIS